MALIHPCFAFGTNLGTLTSSRRFPTFSAYWTGGNTTANLAATFIDHAVTVRNWKIRLLTAPGSGVTRTFTLFKNGVSTSLAISISGTNTEGSDLVDSVSFAENDSTYIEESVSGGSPADTIWYSVFEVENPDDFTALHGFGDTGNVSGTRAVGAFAGGIWVVTDLQTAENIVGVAGTVTGYRVRLSTAPGAGDSQTYTIYKNGVAQDGSGGTPDTRIVVSNAGQVGEATFSLSVVPLDRLRIQQTPSGTPALAACTGTLTFVSNAEGMYNLCGTTDDDFHPTDTEYVPPFGTGTQQTIGGWSTNENIREVICPETSDIINLTGLYVSLTAAPGTPTPTDSVTFTLRKNQVDTDLSVTITGAGVTTGFSLSGLVTVTGADRLSFRAVPTNTPTVGRARIAFVAGPVAPPTVETLIATDVRSTQGRIRGRVDPNGLTGVTGRLAWGTAPGSLDNETDPVAITEGDVFIAFSELLSELTPSTTYYFQAIATYGSNDYLGDVFSFTTLGEQTFVDGEVSHPLTWITLTRRDETRVPYAEVDLNDPPDYYDGYKAPYVDRFLTIARGLSDRDGQIEHLTFGAVFTDTHREFRALLDDPTNKYLTNRPLEEWFIDDEDRRILGLARLAAVGYVNDYAFPPGLKFEIRGADWLKKKFSRKRKAQQSWQPLITAEDFPTCPELTLNTPAPIIYGNLGLSGADPVANVVVTVNAQPSAAPTGFALSLQAGGRYAGVRRYYKVSQIIGGQESIQTSTLTEVTTNTNRTIRLTWTPDAAATAIYVYSSHRPDFSQFALLTLPGSATQYDDDTTPPNQDANHLSGTDWQLGLRMNVAYYVYAELAGGIFSRPGIGSVPYVAPIPIGDQASPLRQRDIDITWDAHPDEVGGYRVIRYLSYYSNWNPVFDRQIDVGTGVTTTSDDIVTTSAVDLPVGEQIALSASGQVEAIFVGTMSAGSPAQTLNALLIARHACSRVGNVYLPNTIQNVDGETETTYTPVPESEFGTSWFAPDHAGWWYPEKYIDINGRRYTLIFTTVSPLPEQVLVDVDGIEENGDGEGDLIESIVLQRLHFMNNWVAPDTPYQSGSYLTAADTTFPHVPDLPLVDEESHLIVAAALEERLAGGYVGATIIGAGGEFVTAVDALARFHMSGDFDQAFNRKGQDTVSCEPVAPTPTDELVAITDIISIRTDSFGIQDQVQSAFFNILPYVHTRDYTGRERGGWYGNEETRSQTSIDNYDQERESPRFELHCCRANTTQGAATIADVMARKLARYEDPRRVGTLTMPFAGLNHEPGSTAAISHVEGIGASGWELKEVRFTRHEVDPTEGTVRLDFYDLTKVFENQGSP